MKIFLISEDKLKTETTINDNIDSLYLHSAIELAQYIGLRELIGCELHDKLCSLVADGSISNLENKKYKELLDEYVTPYLKYKVCSEITLPLAYKYRNSGVVQTNNEHEVNTAMKDAQTLKSYYEEKANFFGLALTSYLKQHNFLEYPNYDSCSKIARGYQTNIVL